MASTLAAVTTGVGGIVATADNSGNISILAGSTAALACTATGTTIAGVMALSGNYTEGVVANGTVGSTKTLDLTSGTVHTATLTASTPCTFTMPTATAGKSFALILTQAATGMTTATFTSVKYPGGTAPTITATASAVDILTFVANGSVWYGTYAQAFA